MTQEIKTELNINYNKFPKTQQNQTQIYINKLEAEK